MIKTDSETKLAHLFDLKQPIELIYLTSCGISATLEDMSYKKDLPYSIVFIDFAAIENFENNTDFYNKFDNLIKRYLMPYIDQHKIKDLQTDSNLFTFLDKLSEHFNNEDKKIIFILKNLELREIYKKERFLDFILKLESWRSYSSGKINFIAIAPYPLNFSKYALGLSIRTHIMNFYFPEHAEIYTKKMYTSLSLREPDAKEIQYIWRITGGILGLIKELARDSYFLYPNTQVLMYDIPINLAFFEEFNGVTNRIRKIITSFSAEYQESLIKLAQDLPTVSNDHIEALKQMGVIDTNNEIRSILLKEYLKAIWANKTGWKNRVHNNETPSAHSIELGETIINNDTYEVFFPEQINKTYLSKTEYKIVQHFIQNKGVLISRDAVADILWGTEAPQKYSDWAIDKTISRIRKKLGDSKKPNKIIVTLKERGFVSGNI